MVVARSDVALGMALAATFGFLLLVFVDDAVPGGTMRTALLLDALLLHIALVVAVWARLGDPAKRGERAGLALAVSAVLVVLWWTLIVTFITTFWTDGGEGWTSSSLHL